ncbi:hypothetical protein [Xylanimonas protaetiae]|uniref:Uncharacterized protein n=1 Tax=Xylanimonas protaetiae TaxID=2509457 RepID=A0A4P6FDG6_9MICO|nr:hypothetical protein [Xylanimonas protaetiae]QAY68628.1 hypothetical protein ET471_00010 [Xylanimonas protaetiae]
MILDTFNLPHREAPQPEAARAQAPDPLAVHRDPSRRPIVSGGTIGAHARVYGNYDWVRVADLSVHAAQGAVGKGIALERALMHTVYCAPARTVAALRQRRAVARERGTLPPAPPSTPTPGEGVQL